MFAVAHVKPCILRWHMLTLEMQYMNYIGCSIDDSLILQQQFANLADRRNSLVLRFNSSMDDSLILQTTICKPCR